MAEDAASTRNRALIINAKAVSRAASWGTLSAAAVSLLALVLAFFLVRAGHPGGYALVAMPVAVIVKSLVGATGHGQHESDD